MGIISTLKICLSLLTFNSQLNTNSAALSITSTMVSVVCDSCVTASDEIRVRLSMVLMVRLYMMH